MSDDNIENSRVHVDQTKQEISLSFCKHNHVKFKIVN